MDLLIFDLDGTLIDSKLDLAHSVNATRRHLGMPPLEHERIYSYVGNGAPVLVRRAMGPEASDTLVAQALDFFLAYYRQHLLDHTVLYAGVKESLDAFRDAGCTLAVLTNKPVVPSRRILEGLGVGDHFVQVYGGNSFDQKKPDPVGVLRLLEETGHPRDRTLMVGDSAVDVRTARNAGIRVCGVSYGFQPETLDTDPPDQLVGSLLELAAAIIPARASDGRYRARR